MLKRIQLLFKLQTILGTLQKTWKEEKLMGLSIGQLFKSKVAWTAVLAAALNIWQVSENVLPHNVVEIGNAALALLTILFRKNPTQQPPALQPTAEAAKLRGE